MDSTCRKYNLIIPRTTYIKWRMLSELRFVYGVGCFTKVCGELLSLHESYWS